MKKYLIVLAISFVGCQGPVNIKEKTCHDDVINPNGSSELSLLMRKMTGHAEDNKIALLNGTPLPPFPENIESILTAERTEKDLDDQLFKGLAKVYLQRLKEFESAPDSLKIKAHNNLVSSCKDCHSNFCGGPLKRIEKMYIEQ